MASVFFAVEFDEMFDEELAKAALLKMTNLRQFKPITDIQYAEAGKGKKK